MAAFNGSLRSLLSGALGTIASEVLTFTDRFSWSGIQAYTAANTHTGAETHTGVETHTGAETFQSLIMTGAGALRLGAGEAVTIATGVATITRPFVVLDAEGAGTTDQLDTITYTGAVAGQVLLLTVTATDTITVDDANINLAAATRAIAPGGALLLYFDGTEWTELVFIAATDNV